MITMRAMIKMWAIIIYYNVGNDSGLAGAIVGVDDKVDMFKRD